MINNGMAKVAFLRQDHEEAACFYSAQQKHLLHCAKREF